MIQIYYIYIQKSRRHQETSVDIKDELKKVTYNTHKAGIINTISVLVNLIFCSYVFFPPLF